MRCTVCGKTIKSVKDEIAYNEKEFTNYHKPEYCKKNEV
jgi:hypothetical protein